MFVFYRVVLQNKLQKHPPEQYCRIFESSTHGSLFYPRLYYEHSGYVGLSVQCGY